MHLFYVTTRSLPIIIINSSLFHSISYSKDQKAEENNANSSKSTNNSITTQHPPILTRDEAIKQLKHSKGDNEYDILIIGGGSTGAGAALDAASRGLKVVCIDREDFSSGTSSRSTKLIWGGSRYLVQALISLFSTNIIFHPITTIKKFKADFKMVLNCHRERKFLLVNQPHLTHWVRNSIAYLLYALWYIICTLCIVYRVYEYRYVCLLLYNYYLLYIILFTLSHIYRCL